VSEKHRITWNNMDREYPTTQVFTSIKVKYAVEVEWKGT